MHIFLPRSGEGASVWGGVLEEQGLEYGGAGKRKGVCCTVGVGQWWNSGTVGWGGARSGKKVGRK